MPQVGNSTSTSSTTRGMITLRFRNVALRWQPPVRTHTHVPQSEEETLQPLKRIAAVLIIPVAALQTELKPFFSIASKSTA